MDYVFANTALCMFLAALIGFVSAALALWWFFRSLSQRKEAEHHAQFSSVLASMEANLEASEKKRREAEVLSEEMKGAAEADAAKVRALEARLVNQEESARIALQKKSAEADQLREELAGSAKLGAEQIASLERELGEFKAAKQKLEAQLSEDGQHQESKIRDFEGVIALLREEASAARSQKQAAEAQARDIEQEFRKMMAMREEEFRAMQAQTVAAAEAQKKFQKEVSVIRSEVSSREAEIGRLTAELDQLRSALPQLEQIREELKDAQSNLSERNELLSKLEADAGLLSHVRHGMRERQTRIDGLQLQLSNANQEIEELKAQLRARNESVAKLEADAGLLSHVRHGMRERQTRIDGLQLQLSKANKEIEESREQLRVRNESAAKLEADAALLFHVRQGMRERQTQIDGLKLQLRDARAEIQRLASTPSEYVEAIAAKDRQLQLLEANLMEAKSAEDSRMAAMRAEFAEALAAKDLQIQSLQARVESAEAVAATTQAKLAEDPRVATLQAELADREERLEAWESRYEAAIGQMHASAGLARMRDTQQSEAETKPLTMAAAVGGAASLVSQPPARDRVPAELQARLRLASLRGVQFLPDSDVILPESTETLAEALYTLSQMDPDYRVEIGGHTDSWGEPAYNRELSLRRAKAVRRYLVEHGIPAAMLIATGYGDSRPIADNESADGRFANRRIEFQVRGPVR